MASNNNINPTINDNNPAKSHINKLNILAKQQELDAQGDSEAIKSTPEIKTPADIQINGVNSVSTQSGSGNNKNNKTFYFIHDNYRFKVNSNNVDNAAKKGFERFKNIAKENKSQITFYIQNINGQKKYKYITKIEHLKNNTRFIVQKYKI
jgi:hypothetical protein